MRPYDFFSEAIKADQAFFDFNSALHKTNANDDIRPNGQDHVLWLSASNGDRIFNETISGDEEEQLQFLRRATGAVYVYAEEQNTRLTDATTRVFSEYGAVHKLDLNTDLEEAMQYLLCDLRQRCDDEGFDFDALSQQSPSLRL